MEGEVVRGGSQRPHFSFTMGPWASSLPYKGLSFSGSKMFNLVS